MLIKFDSFEPILVRVRRAPFFLIFFGTNIDQS